MHRYKILFLITFLCIASKGYSQTDSLQIMRVKVTKVLSDLQDTLNKYPDNPYFANLLSNTSQIIIQLPNNRSIQNIKRIWKYFVKGSKILTNTKKLDDKKQVAKLFNEDLELKLNQRDSLNIEPQASFGKDYKVTADVSIQNKIKDHNYRLYWATALAPDEKITILRNSPDGVSQSYKNPYSIEIELPGIITFWLKDETNSIVYKSNMGVPYTMSPSDLNIQLTFSELK